jgi:hypothetical protein
MSKETVRKILVQDLGIRNLAAKLAPLTLDGGTKEQKSHFVHGLRGTTARR